MRERGNPDRRWSAAKASEQGNQNRFPIQPLIPEASEPPTVGASVSPETPLVNKKPSSTELPISQGKHLEDNSVQKSGPISKLKSSVPTESPAKLERWWRSWQFWAVLATITAGGVGITAIALLLMLPTVPNCPSIYWPTASASMRLYCAQLAAKKQTSKDLLEAIAMVKTLPLDHPLRSQANQMIKEWSLEILDLAETSFNAGKLNEAIAMAKQVPADVPAYTLVESRIKGWQSVWSKAEGIYKEAEKQVRQENWSQAFREAVRLLYIGNTYWETTKYEELNQLIVSARDDGDILARARNLGKRGGLKNLLEAVKLAESINPKSYLYQEAQKSIGEFGREMMDLAESQLQNQNIDEAIAILRQIPARANLQAEVQDLTNLAEAYSVAKGGTPASLEQAIALVKKLSPDRPLYSKGQDLIVRWQRELEDLAHLEKARQLAQLGTANDLKSAIKEAQLIPANHPRAQEAKMEIGRWTSQIQTIEDRPYLNRSDQMAVMGDETSLQAAIEEAKQIAPGRALYGEAQEKVAKWTGQIQRIQDQPYLDQARQLASSGNLVDAIAIAQQIRPGRSLSGEAQAAIRSWQGQIQAQQNLEEARRFASQATPDALASAIRSANRVPSSSALRAEAENLMNQWSFQLLSQAQDRATYDIAGAIAIARTIPSGTNAYGEARAQIEVWQNILNPPPAPPPPPAPSPAEPVIPSPNSAPEQSSPIQDSAPPEGNPPDNSASVEPPAETTVPPDNSNTNSF
ncbi:MAG TPA: hypothetical protein V6D28_13825 [Leptolyngbyaceae cyanobacterium]